ncbi:MAG: MATE family efflux transporter, partial [Eubacteriales bacterium]|nr:MATE family efflux transporter [Eubacteriales bacterium]
AALATLISRIAEFAVVMAYFIVVDQKLRYRFKHLFKLDTQLLKDYIRVGIPVVLTLASWGVVQSVHTGILGHMGSPSLIASNVAGAIFQVVTVITSASGSAAAVLIGKTVGSGRLDLVKPYSRTLQVIFVGMGFIASALLFFGKDLLLRIYALSPESHALSIAFIQVLSVTVIGSAYQASTIGGIIRGGGNTRFMMFNDLIFSWLVVTPLSLLAAFVLHWPPVVVFFFLKIDQLLKCVVAYVKVNHMQWIRQLTRGNFQDVDQQA